MEELVVRSTRLKKNQRIKLTSLLNATIIDKLGEGGQGTVYKIMIDGVKEEKALKWYFIEKIPYPKQFYANLKANIQTGSPSNSFIWPEILTEQINGTFGYVMRIFPKEYKSFSKFLLAQVGFSSYIALVNAALNIVQAFEDLHNKGYNYQDLNDGNFSINPITGDVLICDNDNVMGHGQKSGIKGKARYMAPEVVREEKDPDKITDRFSLAIILFLLMIGDHPLEGEKTNVPCLTSSNDKKFFGYEPIFMFDELDASNRPVKKKHTNAISCWPCFPPFIQNAFKKSFSQESLMKSEGRLLERVWRHYLVRLKSSIIKCPSCGNEMFIEPVGETICYNCKKRTKVNGYLKFLKKRSSVEIIVPIFDGVCLFNYHINESSYDCHSIEAIILTKPGKYGLENKSKNIWIVISIDGVKSAKKQSEVALLSVGTRIDFGNNNIVEVIVN